VAALDTLLRRAAAAPPMPPPVVLGPGTVLAGAFRIDARIGAGGGGVVYRARDVRLNRDVAVKLHRDSDDRLLDEARVTARLAHPNVVAVYEVGVVDGRLFLAMEYVAGGTLRAWLRSGKRTTDEVLDRFLAAARGLAAAHDAGLVHRDFKPDNVLVGVDGRVRVADFGLARDLADADDPDAGAAVGTPAFMSPEQRRGAAADARSDQYSFCCALDAAIAAAAQPRWLRPVLARGLDEDPERRWPSMRALISRIERARRVRRLAVVAAITVVAGGAIAAGAWTMRGDPIEACRASSAPLAEGWNAGRREAVRAALAGCPTCRADGVIAGLERYASTWTLARRDVCVAEAARADTTTAVRIECLDRARAQLAALTGLLADADPTAARFAAGAVAELPPVSSCTSASVVSVAPPPTDPDRRPVIDAAIREVAAAEALWSLGHRDAALPRAQAAVEHARAVAHPSLRARTLYVLGMIQDERRDPAAAVTLEEAALAALGGGGDELAIATLSELGFYLGTHGRAAEGERTSRQAEAMLERLGSAPDLERIVVGERAMILGGLGRFPAAIDAAKRAVELARAHAGPVAVSLVNLGMIQHDAGDDLAARESYAAARATAEPELGPDHPVTIKAIAGLGIVEERLGNYASSIEHLRAVVAAQARLYTDGDVRRADGLANLAAAVGRTGEQREALALLEEVLAIREAAGVRVAEVLGNLAIVHVGLGDLERAHELARRSLAAFEDGADPDDTDLVNPRLIAGTIARVLGRLDEASAAHESALPLALRLPADHPTLANARVEVALTRMAQGRRAGAVPLLEAALATYGRIGASEAILAEARTALARAAE
jgi:tetratricopeptide (TPR) repeat protein/tRNA A-37 threonylcarbamoyl transferase component Bud32